MKYLRIWLCLVLAFIVLPVAVLAAEHDYQRVPENRIRYSLPAGMKAEVSKKDGELDILIDAEKTDWGLVLASSLTEWNTIASPIGAENPVNAVSQHNIHMTGKYSGEPNINDVLSTFDIIVADEFSNDHTGSLHYQNVWDIANYNSENNAVLPIVRASNKYSAHLVVWNMADGSKMYEYFMVNIRFTDDSAREVELNTVDKDRLLPDAAAESTVSDGMVSYQIADDSTVKGSDLRTGIIAPKGAASYRLSYDGDTLLPMAPETLSNGKSGAILPKYVPYIDTIESSAVSIYWYASADGTGAPIAIEHLTVKITVGTPKPFPRYIDELKAVPSSNLLPVITNDGATANPSFISADYADDSDSFDILYKRVKSGKVPAGADLSGYATKLYAAAPANAIAYSVTFRTRSTIYGSMNEYYENNFVPVLADPQNRKLISETVNGQKAAMLHQAPLFKTHTFSHDPSLTLYTNRDDTDPNTGRVIVVYWYDSMDENAKPIGKEYIIDKSEPFSTVQTSPAYDSEDDIGSSISMPVVVTGNNVGILNLMLVIENPVYTGEYCTLYGLHLADAEGNKVVIGDKVTIILPYPEVEGDINQTLFSINHYNEKYEHLETYSEENGLLIRTPIGLAFQTESFSPFALSWDDSSVTAAGTLPETGDASLPLPLLLGMALLSMLAILGQRRRRA